MNRNVLCGILATALSLVGLPGCSDEAAPPRPRTTAKAATSTNAATQQQACEQSYEPNLSSMRSALELALERARISQAQVDEQLSDAKNTVRFVCSTEFDQDSLSKVLLKLNGVLPIPQLEVLKSEGIPPALARYATVYVLRKLAVPMQSAQYWLDKGSLPTGITADQLRALAQAAKDLNETKFWRSGIEIAIPTEHAKVVIISGRRELSSNDIAVDSMWKAYGDTATTTAPLTAGEVVAVVSLQSLATIAAGFGADEKGAKGIERIVLQDTPLQREECLPSPESHEHHKDTVVEGCFRQSLRHAVLAWKPTSNMNPDDWSVGIHEIFHGLLSSGHSENAVVAEGSATALTEYIVRILAGARTCYNENPELATSYLGQLAKGSATAEMASTARRCVAAQPLSPTANELACALRADDRGNSNLLLRLWDSNQFQNASTAARNANYGLAAFLFYPDISRDDDDATVVAKISARANELDTIFERAKSNSLPAQQRSRLVELEALAREYAEQHGACDGKTG